MEPLNESSSQSVNDTNALTEQIVRYVFFCGNAGKEIKKKSPISIPYLEQTHDSVKKVNFSHLN